MQVEVVSSFGEANAALGTLSDSAVERALKNFLGTVQSDDSFFETERLEPVLFDASEVEKICAGTIVLRFRDTSQAKMGSYLAVIEKLTELLKAAGSAESLVARLMLAPAAVDRSKQDLSIRLRLEASGTSPEQAGLRWSLGLAHVQQALLFISRYLRQQLGQREE